MKKLLLNIVFDNLLQHQFGAIHKLQKRAVIKSFLFKSKVLLFHFVKPHNFTSKVRVAILSFHVIFHFNTLLQRIKYLFSK